MSGHFRFQPQPEKKSGAWVWPLRYTSAPGLATSLHRCSRSGHFVTPVLQVWPLRYTSAPGLATSLHRCSRSGHFVTPVLQVWPLRYTGAPGLVTSLHRCSSGRLAYVVVGGDAATRRAHAPEQRVRDEDLFPTRTRGPEPLQEAVVVSGQQGERRALSRRGCRF